MLGKRDRYQVVQCVLTEAFVGKSSTMKSLKNLQDAINEQADKGYRLHSFSTVASGSSGFRGGDKIQVTMVFELIE